MGILGHAPARVDGACPIILAWDVTEAAQDTGKRCRWPTPRSPPVQPVWPQAEAGQAQAISATRENGSESAAAAQALADGGGDPSLAPGRQPPHAPAAEASAAPATAPERMAANGRTPAGKA